MKCLLNLKLRFFKSFKLDQIVHLYVQEIHSNEKSYGANPNEFDAFRHLRNSFATHIERNFITFGLDKHAFPGRFLAVNGIKIILHFLLLKYNIKNVGNKIKSVCRLPNDSGMILEK